MCLLCVSSCLSLLGPLCGRDGLLGQVFRDVPLLERKLAELGRARRELAPLPLGLFQLVRIGEQLVAEGLDLIGLTGHTSQRWQRYVAPACSGCASAITDTLRFRPGGPALFLTCRYVICRGHGRDRPTIAVALNASHDTHRPGTLWLGPRVLPAFPPARGRAAAPRNAPGPPLEMRLCSGLGAYAQRVLRTRTWVFAAWPRIDAAPGASLTSRLTGAGNEAWNVYGRRFFHAEPLARPRRLDRRQPTPGEVLSCDGLCQLWPQP